MGDQSQGAADRIQARLDQAGEGGLRISVMVFPGTGIQANLADKGKEIGIPVWKSSDGRAGAPLQPSVNVSASDARVSLRGPVSGSARPRTAKASRATPAEVPNAAS
jgi:hypothetical protein